ncbi:MAG: FAD-dependent oxidoreductase [Clostridiales bacterium]
MKYLIIGNSAAGVFAADAIRERDKEGEIEILSTEKEKVYSRCLTTYYLSGQISENGMYIRPDDYYEKNRIKFKGGVRVTGISVAEKLVQLKGGEVVNYDKLLIASGASATRGSIEGARESDIYLMRTMEHAKNLMAQVKKGKNRVVVLGGGLVSLKTAGALGENGVDVTIVVTSQNILSQQFDKIGADLIMERLKDNGVKFILGASAKKLHHHFTHKTLELTNGEEIQCDVVFMGKGVVPNTEFLPQEIELAGNGIKVDKYMRTTVKDVYAAGDVATSFDKLTGKPSLYAIWPIATEQGEIAGANMAGDNLEFLGSVSMNSLHFFGLNAICGGDSREKIPGSVEEHYLCGERNIYQKCVFADGRLTGFILVGKVANAGILMGRLGEKCSFEQCMDILENGFAALKVAENN